VDRLALLSAKIAAPIWAAGRPLRGSTRDARSQRQGEVRLRGRFIPVFWKPASAHAVVEVAAAAQGEKLTLGRLIFETIR